MKTQTCELLEIVRVKRTDGPEVRGVARGHVLAISRSERATGVRRPHVCTQLEGRQGARPTDRHVKRCRLPAPDLDMSCRTTRLAQVFKRLIKTSSHLDG